MEEKKLTLGLKLICALLIILGVWGLWISCMVLYDSLINQNYLTLIIGFFYIISAITLSFIPVWKIYKRHDNAPKYLTYVSMSIIFITLISIIGIFISLQDVFNISVYGFFLIYLAYSKDVKKIFPTYAPLSRADKIYLIVGVLGLVSPYVHLIPIESLFLGAMATTLG